MPFYWYVVFVFAVIRYSTHSMKQDVEWQIELLFGRFTQTAKKDTFSCLLQVVSSCAVRFGLISFQGFSQILPKAAYIDIDIDI